jgi:hypothetical protein
MEGVTAPFLLKHIVGVLINVLIATPLLKKRFIRMQEKSISD